MYIMNIQLIEFSLKNIKSDSVVNTKFKRVYNKNIKDILNEMLL